MSDVRWAPPPRYLMRAALVEPLVADLRPSRVLEVGSATGDMVQRILAPGMHVTACEISETAHEILLRRFRDHPQVTVTLGDFARLDGPFDLIMSFAVIEHIPDDRAAMARWFEQLEPGGHLLLSVPARRKLWSRADEVAGHLRRYEKAGLAAMTRDCGFRIVHLWSYGFPLARLTAPFNRLLTFRAMRGKASTAEGLTKESGVDRTAAHRLRFVLNKWTLAPFAQLQKLFLRRDWGNGYLLLARRPAATNDGRS